MSISERSVKPVKHVIKRPFGSVDKVDFDYTLKCSSIPYKAKFFIRMTSD